MLAYWLQKIEDHAGQQQAHVKRAGDMCAEKFHSDLKDNELYTNNELEIISRLSFSCYGMRPFVIANRTAELRECMCSFL